MDDQAVWDLYYMQLCGWLYHPGYLRDPDKRPTLEQAAELATEMLKVRQAQWQQLPAQ